MSMTIRAKNHLITSCVEAHENGVLSDEQYMVINEVLFGNVNVRSHTPLGTIYAYGSRDGEHPGIYVDFCPAGDSYGRAVALIEYDEGNIVAKLWDKGNISDDADAVLSREVYNRDNLLEQFHAADNLVELLDVLDNTYKDGIKAYDIEDGDEGEKRITDTRTGRVFTIF